MAFEFAAFEVDVFGRGEPRPQIDAQRDQCVDIHVVTVGPTTKQFGAQADPGQALAQCGILGDVGGGHVSGGQQREVDDPAPVGPVTVVVHIPLRIQRCADADGGTGPAAIGEPDTGRQGPGLGARVLGAAHRSHPQLATGFVLGRRLRRAEQLAQQVRQRPRIDGCLEQFEDGALPAVLVIVVVRLDVPGGVDIQRHALPRCRADDHAEPIRRLGHRLPAAGHVQ